MSVKRLPSGKWQADYYERDESGKLDSSDRPKRSFSTKQQAKDWEHEKKRDRDTRKYKNKNRFESPSLYRTIQEAITYYKNLSDYIELRQTTRDRYEYLLRGILQFCEEQNIKYMIEFTPERVKEYETWVNSKSKGKGRIHRLVMAKIIFKSDMQRSSPVFTRNPFDIIKLPKVRRKEPRWFTDEELAALFKYAEEYQFHRLNLLLTTGMRRNEARCLPISHIQNGFIRIDDYKDFKPKSFKSYRSIPIIKQAEPSVEYFLKTGKEYLIEIDGKRTGENLLPDTYGMVKRAAMKATGMEFKGATLHSFRRTYGSHLLRAGATMAQIADLMGHESVTTTERIYAGLMQSDRNEAAMKVQNWMENKKFY